MMAAATAAMEGVHGGGGGARFSVQDRAEEDDDEDDIPGLEDKRTKRGFSKRVTLRDLERYFEYPIEEVSRMMGVSTTIIKRLCRKYGIKRWPYRQVGCPCARARARLVVPAFFLSHLLSCVAEIRFASTLGVTDIIYHIYSEYHFVHPVLCARYICMIHQTNY